MKFAANMKFAAGDPGKGAKGAQTGKRAGSMDGKEFLALLEYLRYASSVRIRQHTSGVRVRVGVRVRACV